MHRKPLSLVPRKLLREVARPASVVRIKVRRSTGTAPGHVARASAAAPTPPFNECPPIGADTSCGILVQVTDSENNIIGDPSQGPFDGTEDTLIGVLNSSSSTITSMQLSSNTNLFGFDGDGLCTGYSPGPAGCPFGSTEYEGPSTSFSDITPDQTGGVVNFTGGLAPGQTAYFSLEEPLTATTVIVGGPTAGEQGGSSNLSENPTTCSRAQPVNCATGVFWHQFTDLAIPGRGAALNFSRTYSSSQAATDGPLGFGWTDSYNMSLATDASGNAMISQENGSTVTFQPNGAGGFTGPPRVLATLTANSDGTFTFIRDRGQTQYVFSAAGQLTGEIDRNGYQTVLGYNGSGQLTSVTDPAGRQLTFTYSGSHIATVTDPMGRAWSYTYDGSGNLVGATDPMGRAWSFSYDSGHLMLTMTDPRGGVTTNTYDGSGRVVTQVDPLGRTTTWSYSGNPANSAGGTTTMTDPAGNVTTYNYSNLELTSVTHAVGTAASATTSYTYDPATLGITSVTDPNGNVTTNTYDSGGNLLSTTNPLGNATSYSYNSFDEILSKTSPLGETTNYSYDANGNLLTVSDPLGNTTTYAYGDSAHPGDVTSATDADGNVITYAYDDQGDVASMSVSPSAGVTDTTAYAYDADGERTCEASPNATNASVTCPPAGSPPVADTTATSYDADGEVISVTDPIGRATTSAYDADGNLMQVTDPAGHIISYTYNLDDELTKLTRPDGSSVSKSYDANGNLASQADAAGNKTSYAYDALNQVVSVTDPLGRIMSYGYDTAGNQTTVTDPSGRTTTYSYDTADELTGITYSDGTTPAVSYAYDADGRRSSMTDGTGTSTYTYDADGRLVSLANGAGATVSYSYDAVGLLTSLTYPNGQSVTRSYDGAERLTSASDWLGNVTSFSYDANGNLTSVAYPNGVTAKSSYDNADQLMGIADKTASATLATFSYARDALGQVTSAIGTGAAQGTQSYSYSQLNQLASDSNGAYGYDPAGGLTQLPGGITQKYDAGDELTSTTRPVAIAPTADRVASGNEKTKGSKITSPPITTSAANELVLAFVSANGPKTTRQQITRVSGGGLTWSLAVRANRKPGTAEVWQADAATQLSGVKVTATLRKKGYDGSIIIATFTGADAVIGASGARSGATGAPGVSLTTTKPSSLVWAAGEDPSHATTIKAVAGQTIVHQFLDKTGRSTDWAQNTAAVPQAGVLVTVADAKPATDKWNMAAVEITSATQGTSTTTYSYDKEGDRTGIAPAGGPTTSLTYDQAGRLTGYGANATYAYDGDGLRMSKTVGGTTTAFTWDQSGALPLVLAAGSTYYVYGPGGQAIEQISGSTAVYLHVDQQGSTRLLTSQSGAVVGTYAYDSYGQIKAHVGTSTTALQFDGQYTDAESGYQYLRARYYDSATAQFLNADPAAPLTRQPYEFASSDPVDLADLTGLYATAVCITVTGGGHVGVGGSVSFEVCNWLGSGGWGAETVSLSGGLGFGGGLDVGGSYTAAVDPNANSPQDLGGGSATVSYSATAGGGISGSFSHGSGGFSGEIGGTVGAPDVSVEGGGGYTWVVGSSTGYTSSLIPPGLKSLYDHFSDRLKQRQSPACGSWTSGQGDFPDVGWNFA